MSLLQSSDINRLKVPGAARSLRSALALAITIPRFGAQAAAISTTSTCCALT